MRAIRLGLTQLHAVHERMERKLTVGKDKTSLPAMLGQMPARRRKKYYGLDSAPAWNKPTIGYQAPKAQNRSAKIQYSKPKMRF